MRPVLLAFVAVVALNAAATPQERQQPFVERIEVARILIDARAFDDAGEPMADLDASDFKVKIGGRQVDVESAEWIGATAGSPETSSGPAPAAGAASVSGRLIVFLVQRDLEPVRIRGLMQMSQLVDRLLEPLTRDDRIAVVSFDSRLHMWTDFTGDLGRVRRILGSDVITRTPPAVSASPGISLVARLDRASDKRIYHVEGALRRIAESLESLPGAKTLIVLGYGFGRFDGHTGSVTLMDGYEEASAALQRARVAVFTLNVTQADFNSLQAGLQTVSAETGGTYASTYEFPGRAIRDLARALTGHYVLFVDQPELPHGAHSIDVRLTRRKGTVVARSSWSN